MSKKTRSPILMKKGNIHKIFREKNLISPFDRRFGTFGDEQVPNVYCVYGDTLTDTIMHLMTPEVEKATNTIESTPIQSGGAKGEFGGITNQKATVVNTAANENIDYGETPPYTSATVNNERTAEIARGPDQTVTTIPDVNADLSSSWNPPADVLQNAPPTFTPTPPPVRVVTPSALEDQTVETI